MFMKSIHTYSRMLLLAVVAGALSILTSFNTYAQEKGQFNPSKDSIAFFHEFRGVWLTTVRGSDWPRNIKINYERLEGESKRRMEKRIERQRDSQKVALVDLMKKIKSTGSNAVMVQMVCNSESYYCSKILPWDYNLTGTQGVDPGYDPLKLAVETGHKLGMEVHAWLNPMRIGSVENERVADHPCKVHPEFVQTYNKTMYWDPSNPEVVDYLYRLVTEIVTNYNVDGIHIDDYFYPDGLRGDEKDTMWKDGHNYAKYLKAHKAEVEKKMEAWKAKLCGTMTAEDSLMIQKDTTALTLDLWREVNVNNVVRAMHTATHKANPNAVFGVSPGGRLVNTQRLYADPQHWIAEGTIDYLIPQIYWQHGHKVADYKLVLDSWKDIMKDVPMFVGMGAYRYKSTGFETMDEFMKQMEEAREADYVYGNVWFTAHSLFKDDFLPYMQKNIYPYESLAPKLGTSTYPAPAAPELKVSGEKLHWESVADADGYAVYELSPKSGVKTKCGGAVWEANMVKRILVGDQKHDTKFAAEKGKTYVVLATRGKEKSEPSNVVRTK